MSLLIGILTFVLILTSLFLVLVVLMQRAKSDGGMGSALGGGSMESTFGAETGNVLSGATIKASILFFVVSFTLYLAHIYQNKHHDMADTKLPAVIAPATTPAPQPAVTAPATKPALQPETPAPVEPKKPLTSSARFPTGLCFLVLAALAVAGLVAQDARYRPPPTYVSGGKADQNEGAQILRDFRAMDIAGTYWLAFELRVLPRQGAERTIPGQLLVSRTAAGPVSRLTLPGAGGLATEQRWLIQSGPQAAAWIWTGATSRTEALPAAASFQPIAGTDLTLFDLQMPYLYWPEFIYEGVAKVRGRPAHSFVLYPPAELAAARPELTGVRVLLDTEFRALVQAELLGTRGETVKSFTVLDLKKVGEQWMLKSIDLRNHRTRDKTRFTVTAAALKLALPPETFTSAGLAAEAPAVPAAMIERF